MSDFQERSVYITVVLDDAGNRVLEAQLESIFTDDGAFYGKTLKVPGIHTVTQGNRRVRFPVSSVGVFFDIFSSIAEITVAPGAQTFISQSMTTKPRPSFPITPELANSFELVFADDYSAMKRLEPVVFEGKIRVLQFEGLTDSGIAVGDEFNVVHGRFQDTKGFTWPSMESKAFDSFEAINRYFSLGTFFKAIFEEVV